MAKRLTAAAADRLRPGPKRRTIPDGGGLYLVIQPSGVKSWTMQYRRPGDQKMVKLTLGRVDLSGREGAVAPAIGEPMTLAAARHAAADIKLKLKRGEDVDLVAEKRRRAVAAEKDAANTFAAAAKDYIQEYAKIETRRWHETARLLGLNPNDLTLIPRGLAWRWEKKPVANITPEDIDDVVDETRRRGAPGLERRKHGPTKARARAMMSCLSQMFTWLKSREGGRRVPANPCSGLDRPEAPQPRDRVLDSREIKIFWAATDSLPRPFGAALKLLLLTGCRLNEVCGMRRSEISDDGSTWTIPGERTKNRRAHVVHLAQAGRGILRGVEAVEGVDLVFTTNLRKPISGWSKVKRQLDAEMKIQPWRIHDLRRTAVTGMAELGIRSDVIERVVNHVSGSRAGVAGIYNKSELLSERVAALERWAAHVWGIVTGVRGAEVVPLRR
jgi:integrase